MSTHIGDIPETKPEIPGMEIYISGSHITLFTCYNLNDKESERSGIKFRLSDENIDLFLLKLFDAIKIQNLIISENVRSLYGNKL